MSISRKNGTLSLIAVAMTLTTALGASAEDSDDQFYDARLLGEVQTDQLAEDWGRVVLSGDASQSGEADLRRLKESQEEGITQTADQCQVGPPASANCPPGTSPPACSPGMTPDLTHPSWCLPITPYSPLDPVPVPPLTEPGPPSPAPAEEMAPAPTPEQQQRIQDLLSPETPAPPLSPVRTQPTAPTTFGGLGGGALLASSQVPAMIGDFFGGSGAATICIPGMGIDLDNTLFAQFTGQDFVVSYVPGVNVNDPIPFPDISIGNIGGGRIQSVESQAMINANFLDLPGDTRFGVAIAGSDEFLQAFNQVAAAAALSETSTGSPGLETPGLAGQQGFTVVTRGTATLASFSNTNDLIVSPDQPPFGFHIEPNAGIGDNVEDNFDISFSGEFVPIIQIQIPIDAVTGRVKLSENSSPVPRDRVIFNYSFFDNVPLVAGGVSVNRFTPGFEKTWWDGDASIEVRAPFAATLDSDIVIGGVGATPGVASSLRRFEFGNVTGTFKFSLFQTETVLFGAGLGVALPTADAVSVALDDGSEVLRVDNDSVHFLPYLGMTWAPNSRFFSTFVVQADAASHDDDVFVNVNPNGFSQSFIGPNGSTTFGAAGLQKQGGLKDATFLYADASAGYWFVREPETSGLTGFAGLLELHYNANVENFESLAVPIPGSPKGVQINQGDDIRQLNMVVGALLEFGQDSLITLAYGVPLTSDDELFDGELRVNYTHRFGRSSQRTGPNRFARLR